MCGLAGAILGKKRRRRDELRVIGGIFTELLLLNQTRGTDAAGVAVVCKDGTFKLLKRPGPAAGLVADKLYCCVLELDNKVTAILGHTRRKSRGSEQNSLNNHPLRTGRVLGTHNGHLANADRLARKHRLRRVAEVDSEVLFRLAGRARSAAGFKRLLAGCRGSISAALVGLNEPAKVWLVKGNMPLSVGYVPRLRTVFYASEGWMLDEALDGHQWQELEVDPMTLSTFDSDSVLDFTQVDVAFKDRKGRSWRKLLGMCSCMAR